MEAFEPPKYITSLIATINDGAKAAQTGALAFSAVGLYLIATAVSTTDEDLLLAHTTSIAQLGVQVPAVFSLAVAPLVFVALHVLTLIRYDMLANNLRQFRADLDLTVRPAADQERCRQLLANVEFVMWRAVPHGSSLHSWTFQLIAFGLIAVFPLAVLLTVQISALRLQSDGVNWAQRSALMIDLLILIWFFHRQRLAEGKEPNLGVQRLRLWMTLLWAPAAVVGVNLLWLNVPGPEARTVREIQSRQKAPLGLSEIWLAVSQPLDGLLCSSKSGWGCRFLTVDHRMLVDRVWKSEAIADLRANPDKIKEALAAVEGTFLRRRVLRFATLSESRLYGADMIGADLRHAVLTRTDLRGARLGIAQLQGASLDSAQLQGADLGGAHLDGSSLRNVHLEGANLRGAYLEGAVLGDDNDLESRLAVSLLEWNVFHREVALYETVAHLEGVNLSEAHLRGVELRGAHLEGADLREACMDGADLHGAHLEGADLRGAHLEGAELSTAHLEGADLGGAHLEGADLRGSGLWQSRFIFESPQARSDGGTYLTEASLTPTKAGFVDLRAAKFSNSISEEEREKILQRLSGMPVAQDRVKKGLTPAEPPWGGLKFEANQGSVLVTTTDLGRDALVGVQQLLTTDKLAYENGLVPFLGNLARTGQVIASSIARNRVSYEDKALALRLIADAQAGAIIFSDPSVLAQLKKKAGSDTGAAAGQSEGAKASSIDAHVKVLPRTGANGCA